MTYKGYKDKEKRKKYLKRYMRKYREEHPTIQLPKLTLQQLKIAFPAAHKFLIGTKPATRRPKKKKRKKGRKK